MKRINGHEVITCGDLIRKLMQFRPDTPVYVVNPAKSFFRHPHATIKELHPDSGDAQIILNDEQHD